MRGRGFAGAWLAGLLVVLACLACAHAADAPVQVSRLQLPADAAPPTQMIVQGKLGSQFQVLPRPLLRAPDDRDAWYRVRLAHDWNGASRPLLAISGDIRARVTAYLPPGYAPRTLSTYDADLDPRFSRHALVLVLPRDLRADQPVYVSVGAPGQSQPLRVRISDYASYQAGDLRHVRLSTAFASVEASMLLVILCFWLVLRDRMFLYFLAYMGAQLAYQMSVSGELYVLPGAQWLAPLGYHPGQFAATLAAALSISFILEFAALREVVPQLARVLAWMRWPYFLFAVLVWIPLLDPDAWLPNTVNLLLIVSTLTALFAGWRAWRRGSRQAGFFLIAWLPLLALTLLRVTQLIVGLHLPAWLEYGFPASMAYAAVVITVGLADRTLQVRHERDRANRLAENDPLTGVLNRRAILDRLHEAWQSARGKNQSLAVLFLDLDHFKRVNDTRGHSAGDACLRAVVGAIQEQLAASDHLGRYGGEEFLIVLRWVSARVALQIAQRLCARAAALRVEVGGEPVSLTVSIGVAVMDADTPSAETLVECADTAQYRAKALGRNRVVLYRREEVAQTLATPPA
ncbi:MAG TPA: diguanylate cyclase [Rhodanobacteraceae bacterium]|nr:diguanylate cyclase [Rhodanobacteraceae bacterium]